MDSAANEDEETKAASSNAVGVRFGEDERARARPTERMAHTSVE